VSLRWRIALGFALVALATAAVIALATPPIITQGFSDYDRDSDSDVAAASQVATPTGDNESDDQTNRPSTAITLPVTAAAQQSAEPGELAPVPPSNNARLSRPRSCG